MSQQVTTGFIRCIKGAGSHADSPTMNISDEQVRRAMEILRSGQYADSESHFPDVDPKVIERAMQAVAATPDMRPDRIEHARWMIAEHPPSADEVAAKMLSRIVSDSLR